MAATDDPFDALSPVETPDNDNDDAQWIDLDEEGDTVLGEIREIKDNCGDYNSRTYKVSRGPGDLVIFWGKASIDRQIDAADLGPGDVVGIRNTGEEYTTDKGHTGVRFEVRSQ